MTNIAGAEVGHPAGIDDVTADWLTAVLRTSGALNEDGTVASLTPSRFGEGAGLLSDLDRVAVNYRGSSEGAPATVVVKFPTHDEVQRFTADALGFYQREINFYREIAPDAPFDTPRCFAAIQGDESTDFVLVLEDVGHLRGVSQIDGCSIDEAKIAVETLAAFHAQWWQDPRLEKMGELYLPIQSDFYRAVLPDVFRGGWDLAVQHAGDLYTPATLEFGAAWGDHCGFFLDNLMEPSTLIHGDWRGDNLFFGGDRLMVIDFQIVGVGCGSYDLGYFMSQSLDPDVRHGHDEEIARHYWQTLVDHGVDYAWEDCWRQYRLALAYCLIYAVTSFQNWEAWNNRGRDLLRCMTSRAVSAIEDLDSLELLPG